MSAQRRVVVGIPAYNARTTIAGIVQRVQTQPVTEILVVDDGSRDGTGAVLASLPSIRTLHHPENRGYGSTQISILDDFRASSSSDRDILVFLHADGEMMPEEIPLLLEPFDRDPGVEMVFGSRMLMHDRPRKPAWHVRRPPWKIALDRIATRIQNLAYHARLSTYFGGFRALRSPLLRRLDYRTCHPRHFFDQEFLIRLIASRAKIVEVPISNVETGGVSHYNLFQNGCQILYSALFRGPS